MDGDAYSHPPFQVGVLSFTEHGYPLSSTLRGTSACAVKPFPRHRAKQSQFHGPQRHTTLRGVCLLHPPGTLTLNRSFLLPPFVPGGSFYPCTWHEDPWMEDAYSHPPFLVLGFAPTPGTHTLNGGCQQQSHVPGRRTYSHTWHVLHSSRHLSDPRAVFAAHPSGGLGVARSSLDITNETDTAVSVSSRAENET